jgi:hypothetical protein
MNGTSQTLDNISETQEDPSARMNINNPTMADLYTQ